MNLMLDFSDYARRTALFLAIFLAAAFVCFFLLSMILRMKERLSEKKRKKIIQLLDLLSVNKIELSASLLGFFKKNLLLLLTCMSEFEDKAFAFSNWPDRKQELSERLLKPEARRLGYSSRWMTQYLAVICYRYGADAEDSPVLAQIVSSDVMVVALNAANIIFKYPTSQAVNALIDVLAQSRRIQQSLFVEVLTNRETPVNEELPAIFMSRLNDEKDPYIRAFCYRMLTSFPGAHNVIPTLAADILNNILDLKIAAIYYLASIASTATHEELRQLLQNEQFEVRAVAAKLLGQVHDLAAIPLLEEKLCDSAWWVRVNAAQALSKLGANGILALQRQTPEKDKFAYEVAQKVLITLRN